MDSKCDRTYKLPDLKNEAFSTLASQENFGNVVDDHEFWLVNVNNGGLQWCHDWDGGRCIRVGDELIELDW